MISAEAFFRAEPNAHPGFGGNGVSFAQRFPAHSDPNLCFARVIGELTSEQYNVAIRSSHETFGPPIGNAPILQSVRPVVRSQPCTLDLGMPAGEMGVDAGKVGVGLLGPCVDRHHE